MCTQHGKLLFELYKVTCYKGPSKSSASRHIRLKKIFTLQSVKSAVFTFCFGFDVDGCEITVIYIARGVP